jgi:hypothetical protein
LFQLGLKPLKLGEQFVVGPTSVWHRPEPRVVYVGPRKYYKAKNFRSALLSWFVSHAIWLYSHDHPLRVVAL